MEEKEALYTYYQIDINPSVDDWDYTICETLEDVMDTLKYLDVHLDDPDLNFEVTIKGIGMTRPAFDDWKKENIKP